MRPYRSRTKTKPAAQRKHSVAKDVAAAAAASPHARIAARAPLFTSSNMLWDIAVAFESRDKASRLGRAHDDSSNERGASTNSKSSPPSASRPSSSAPSH